MIKLIYKDSEVLMPSFQDIHFKVFKTVNESRKTAKKYNEVKVKVAKYEEELEAVSNEKDKAVADGNKELAEAKEKIKTAKAYDLEKLSEELDKLTEKLSDTSMSLIDLMIETYPRYAEFSKDFSLTQHNMAIKALGSNEKEIEIESVEEDFLA